jgi:transposase
MERMIERCAGLDVHQATVVAGVLINERGRRSRKELRTFGTMTHELEACASGLRRSV